MIYERSSQYSLLNLCKKVILLASCNFCKEVFQHSLFIFANIGIQGCRYVGDVLFTYKKCVFKSKKK